MVVAPAPALESSVSTGACDFVQTAARGRDGTERLAGCTAAEAASAVAGALLSPTLVAAVGASVAASARSGDALERLTGGTAAVASAVVVAAASSLSPASAVLWSETGGLLAFGPRALSSQLEELAKLVNRQNLPSGAKEVHEKDQLLSRSSWAGPKSLLLGAAT